MTDVTQILDRIEQGDPSAAEKLLPLVYEELRKLAAHRLQQENPGQTLQATGQPPAQTGGSKRILELCDQYHQYGNRFQHLMELSPSFALRGEESHA